MGYAEQNSVEKGLRFKTRSGLVVQTTGSTTHIESTNVYVHEVEVLGGPSPGGKYLHNLDYSEPAPSWTSSVSLLSLPLAKVRTVHSTDGETSARIIRIGTISNGLAVLAPKRGL